MYAKRKLKALSFLNIHENDRNALKRLINQFYKHEMQAMMYGMSDGDGT